jgi:hypothetical protein
MTEPKTAIELLDEACRLSAFQHEVTFPPGELKDSMYFMESADVMANPDYEFKWHDKQSRVVQMLAVMTFALNLGITYERLRRESEGG